MIQFRSIQTKLILLIVAVVICIVTAFMLLSIDLYNRSLSGVQMIAGEMSEKSLRSEWEDKARAMSAVLASQLVKPVYHLDLGQVEYLAGLSNDQAVVDYVFVLNNDAIFLFDSSPDLKNLGKTASEAFSLAAIKARQTLIRHDERILHIGVPIALGDQKLATLQMGFHTAEIKSNIRMLYHNIRSLYDGWYRSSYSKIVYFSLAVICIGMIIALFSARSFIRPIQDLVIYFKKVGQGQHGLQMTNRRSDEVGELIQAFNLMSMNLKKSTISKDELEDIVEKRTLELAETNASLQKEIAFRKDTQKSLEIAKEMAEHANRAKSDFLANMSHELRTPLNHIIGFTELVADQHFGNLNSTQSEYLGDVLQSSRHLLSLINDILDLSKVEAGKMEFNPSTVFLRETLENSMVMIKEKAGKHGIQLSTDFDGIPETITADERKLKQIIYNLLSNAVKFTPDGGKICLTARLLESPPPDEVSDVQDRPQVEIVVADTGIGIAKEDLERILNPFEQVEDSDSRHFQGTGLGLSLTKNLVEMHGGQLLVASNGIDQGSKFSFTLPI